MSPIQHAYLVDIIHLLQAAMPDSIPP